MTTSWQIVALHTTFLCWNIFGDNLGWDLIGVILEVVWASVVFGGFGQVWSLFAISMKQSQVKLTRGQMDPILGFLHLVSNRLTFTLEIMWFISHG